jgi:hypothetical protein
MLKCKQYEWNLSWPNSRSNPGICLEVVRKTTINLSQDNRSPAPKFEPGTSRIRCRSVNDSIVTFGGFMPVMFSR